MKNARHPQMQMTSALGSLNSNSTAQNLSRYAHKKIEQACLELSESGYTIEIGSAGPVLVSPYGLRKQVQSLREAVDFVGGSNA
jgi:hypothetical protein